MVFLFSTCPDNQKVSIVFSILCKVSIVFRIIAKVSIILSIIGKVGIVFGIIGKVGIVFIIGIDLTLSIPAFKHNALKRFMERG